MLTTFDRTQWKEDVAQEAVRMAFNWATPPEVLRQHYPYRGKITLACQVYALTEGQEVPYMRTRHTIQLFPLEGLFVNAKEQSVRWVFFESGEVQLVETK